MKVIILRFSSGGDLILLTGIVNKLLESGVDVSILLKRKFRDIFSGFENLKIYELEDHEGIFREEFNYAFDLQKNLKSFILMKRIKAKEKLSINKRSILRRIYLYLRYPIKEKSMIKIFAEPFEKVFRENFYLRPVLKGEVKFEGLPGKYILIAPFTSKEKKNLSNYVLKKILESESKKNMCVVVGDLKSKGISLPLVNENIVDLRGRTSLRELFYIVKNSDYVITVDSMVSHIASAYKKKGVVIFGPTTPIYGFRPFGEELRVLYNKTFCSPCSLHGEGFCLFNKRCYKKILNKFVGGGNKSSPIQDFLRL
ncbi:MAG: glycosyltransferase family 9 protein [Candidatus Hydrothermales bacterium]